jgi:hypothetical protein
MGPSQMNQKEIDILLYLVRMEIIRREGRDCAQLIALFDKLLAMGPTG